MYNLIAGEMARYEHQDRQRAAARAHRVARALRPDDATVRAAALAEVKPWWTEVLQAMDRARVAAEAPASSHTDRTEVELLGTRDAHRTAATPASRR